MSFAVSSAVNSKPSRLPSLCPGLRVLEFNRASLSHVIMKRFLLVRACATAFLADRCVSWETMEGAPPSFRLMFGMFLFMQDLVTVGSFLGLGDPLVLQHSLMNSMPMDVPAPDGVSIKDTSFDGIPVRIYSPEGMVDNAPAVMYFHGGGWVFDNIEMSNTLCGQMSKNLKALVVSVEYRVAPEHPFPTPLDDCVKATLHLLKTGAKYGVDAHRVAVSGDSAGGNLAAAVAVKLRDLKIEPTLKAQVLLYPALQAIDLSTPSYMEHNQGDTILSRKNMVSFWLYYAQGHIKNLPIAMRNEHVIGEVRNRMADSYLNHNLLDQVTSPDYVRPKVANGNAKVWNEIKDIVMNPYFAPLTAEDVSDLPPTFILICGYDVLRDDSIFFAERLRTAGVIVEKYYAPTSVHGVLSMPFETPTMLKIKEAMLTFLKNKF